MYLKIKTDKDVFTMTVNIYLTDFEQIVKSFFYKKYNSELLGACTIRRGKI